MLNTRFRMMATPQKSMGETIEEGSTGSSKDISVLCLKLGPIWDS